MSRAVRVQAAGRGGDQAQPVDPDQVGQRIAARVLEVAEAQGDLGSFRTLQKQPAWRAQPVEEQLRRFMGSGGRRKIRYARLLVEALDLSRVPRPLDLVLGQ